MIYDESYKKLPDIQTNLGNIDISPSNNRKTPHHITSHHITSDPEERDQKIHQRGEKIINTLDLYNGKEQTREKKDNK